MNGFKVRRFGRQGRLALLGSLILVLAGVIPLAFAAGDSDGNALDIPASNGTDVYRLTVTNLEAGIAGLVARPDVYPQSFAGMIADRGGAMIDCGSACWKWSNALQDDDLWYPQGLTGSRESNWADAPGTEFVVSGWYKRTTVSDHTSTATLMRFISTSDWTYRKVPLRWAYQDNGWKTRPLEAHMGGLAWAGKYIYAASTDTIYRFDLTQVLLNADGPFMVPDRAYTAFDKDPYGAPVLSSLSTDWSSATPALVSARYVATNPAPTDRQRKIDVVRWPLNSDGALSVTDGHVKSAYNLEIDPDSSIDKVQGVESQSGVYFFSTSGGKLHRARVESQVDRETWEWGTDPSIFDVSDIPQDLYAADGHRMYGQTEERTDRRIFWKSMSSVMP